MATLTISLPQQTVKLVDLETSRGGFSTRSEFIRSLLRQYFTKDIPLEPFLTRPIAEIRSEFRKTKKYDKKFIESVVKGLKKSSLYAR